MRALLVALSIPDPASLRAALSAALGTSSVDLCQTPEAAVTWLENRPCDLVAIAGQGAGVVEGVARVRRVSNTIPVLVVVPDHSAREAGAAWLSGADDVITAAALTAGTLPEGLDEVRHPERDVLRRTQRLWYAGPGDALRQHLVTRLGARFREVGLSAEGLVGLTTQDVEAPHSAALIVNALVEPEALVLGVRRVKRTYPGLAITVVADSPHHDAFRRAGADECVGAPDVDPVLHAVGRAQATCRASLELDQVRVRETRLRALLEHLPEAVMLVSPEHAVLAVNLAALRLIGAQDARQVIGTPLSPWFDGGEESPNGADALIDGVAEGATRELFIRTRHLADPRRLQLRAVPFQRETGGRPAALIVLREAQDTPVVEAAPAVAVDVDAIDEQRRAWDEERATLTARVDALTSELQDARGLAESLRSAYATLAETAIPADQREAWDAERAQLAARIDALSSELAEARTLADSLRDAHSTLASEAIPAEERQAWEQERAHLRERAEALASELSEARAREQSLRDTHASLVETHDALRANAVEPDRIHALESRLEQVDALGVDLSAVPGLIDAARRLTVLEQDELPALRDAADALRTERDHLGSELDEARQRVHDLETALADAHAQQQASLEREAPSPQVETQHVAHVDVPIEQRWLLQDIAHVGFVRTSLDGRVLEANHHAARLCGHADADALLAAETMPLPLRLLAEGDEQDAARFEVCLQLADGQAPRWIAGARLPRTGDSESVSWLLADASAHHRDSSAEATRPETLNAVLEVVAAECAAIVDGAPAAVLGPRPVEALSVSPAAAQALDRARVLLAQVSSFRRRREAQTALDELRGHLTALEPVLSRLATDDVEWVLSLPDEPIHVGASASDIERCVTALVTSARDAMPLGGRMALSLETPGPGSIGDADVRRLDVRLVLDVQGYGGADIDVPAVLRELASGFGGEFAVSRSDALSQRVTLRVPRAFVISNAA